MKRYFKAVSVLSALFICQFLMAAAPTDADLEKNNLVSEALISKTELKAIETLKMLIRNNKDKREEPDLLYRLAELYMRRAKSGRFFEIEKTEETKLRQLGIGSQKTTDALKQALSIYQKIIAQYPKYSDIDYVLFNIALAYSQLNQFNSAKNYYQQLIDQHSKSELLPDAYTELGEIYYNDQNFSNSLQHFKKVENYPKSKVYPFALYKSAWCYYNLKDSDSGIKKLVAVVEESNKNQDLQKKYNLRKEALSDLILFTSENLKSTELVSFFQKIAEPNELGDLVVLMDKLLQAHSRHKELITVSEEYISKFPHSAQSPLLYKYMIETYETLTKRDQVIEEIQKMGLFCQNESSSSCADVFKSISLDISKKWWKIWLKNKTHPEFSKLTEEAFEILLKLEDSKNPDYKSRYAYAELLFQQNNYLKASQEYETVSEQSKDDASLKHDALYAAIFSNEKAIEQKENTSNIERQKKLSLRYFNEFSKSEHIDEITLKLALIAYKANDYKTSLQYLLPLSQKLKAHDTQYVKTQDMILDIYNIQKDYATLSQQLNIFIKKTTDKERNAYLKKLLVETEYAQLLEKLPHLEAQEKITALEEFNQKYPDSSKAQSSILMTISEAYKNGLDIKAADLSMDYINKYSEDDKKVDLLKDAAFAYTQAAHFDKAIIAYNKLVSANKEKSGFYKEVICELQLLNQNQQKAEDCYFDIFNQASISKKNEIAPKLVKFFKVNKINSLGYNKLKKIILDQQIEPFATEFLTEQAQDLFDSGDLEKAFSLTLRINARSVEATYRAPARLIQSQVLEIEYNKQSIKASVDHLALVLAMKIEKLDKAFTAASSALKMSKDEKVQLKALQTINRLYQHLIGSVENISLPGSLSEKEKASVKNELSSLIEPFKAKQKSNQDQIDDLTKSGPLSTALNPNINLFKPYLISQNEWPSDDSWPSRQIKPTQGCQADLTKIKNLNNCILENKLAAAKKISLVLTETKSTRSLGLYYLSIISELQKDYILSNWLIDRSLAENTKSKPVLYQKSRLLFFVEGLSTSLKEFEKILNDKTNISELQILRAVKLFSDRDYLKAKDEISRLSSEEIYNYQMESVVTEINKHAQLMSNVGEK